MLKYKILFFIIIAFSLSGCFFDTPFDEFNPIEAKSITKLAYDSSNTSDWIDDLEGIELTYSDLINQGDFETVEKEALKYYSKCKFTSNLFISKGSKLYSTKGKHPSVNKRTAHVISIGTFDGVEGYCEYRAKNNGSFKFNELTRNFEKGDVLFIDEVVAVKSDGLFPQRSLEVVKRYFK